ncbi:carbohydrate-binding module family 12 protein [Marasmius fiardii PR-910]|nr:carbohydrate-binding module family 12 protein [Marasmius fiardii PR-910]
MTAYWEPGTQYNHGDVVEYNGHRYKIVQPHVSQSDWTPDNTPALWGRLQDGDHGYEGHSQPPPANYQPPPQHYPAPPPEQTVNIPKEEEKKHWYDLDDKRKKELEIGGGLALGLGLLGAGFAAYKHHEKSEEEKKSELWALGNWAREAQARRNQWNQHGLTAPVMWIYNEGKSIPNGAITTGQEHDWTLYICRAPVEGGIQIGKASDVFQKGAVIGYDDKEIHLDKYEILVGDMRALRWAPLGGYFNSDALGRATPVEGGRDKDGSPLYVARAPHKGAVHPGKVGKHIDGCLIPYDGGEKKIHEYEVLVYAQ